MMRVIFSQVARNDRQAILRYTVENFGLLQARRLRSQFEAAIRRLTALPHAGHLREDLSPAGRPLRYFPVLGRFVIVYEPKDDSLRVARILHGARDLAAELERDAGE